MLYVSSFEDGLFSLTCSESLEEFAVKIKDGKAVPVGTNSECLFLWKKRFDWDNKPDHSLYELCEDFLLEGLSVLHYSENLGAEVFSSLVGDSFFVSLNVTNKTAKPFDTDAEKYINELNKTGFNIQEFIFKDIVEYVKKVGAKLPTLPTTKLSA